ncbi:MAG TPA: amidohydrolase family protein [Haliangium sp.]|nr:amidohydrolase family protein [Haliangium sp.]
MRDGYRIIDADRHVLEPTDMWADYLEPAFRHRAPYLAYDGVAEVLTERVARLKSKALVPLPPVLMLEGQSVMHKLSERAQIELMLANQRRATELDEGASPEGHLRAMDRDGIDVAFLFPTYASYVISFDHVAPALLGALARAYNGWLHDFCRADPARLRGVGLISVHEPGRMVRELERILEYGWRAVVLRPNPARGRTLGHPAYEPFWRACEQHGVAIAIHEGTHVRLPAAGADRFQSRFALHACSHPMEQMMAFLALVEGGVLERHPGLRVGFLEAGCGWAPYWLWRLDEEYHHLAGEVEDHVKMAPSAYFRRQCFVGFEPGEPYLASVLPHIGAETLLFGTDFPHPDHGGGMADGLLSLREILGEPALRQLLGGNAARFFGLAE